MRAIVQKIGESIPWGPEQEVSLLRYDEWKGVYTRIEDGAALVEEIGRQGGWEKKHVSLVAELVDLKSDSRVGYVPSKMAMQIAEDDWAACRDLAPIVTEVTVLADDGAQEGCDADANVPAVDWNEVELEERTDLVIEPIADTKMARILGIPVPDEDRDRENARDGGNVAGTSGDVDPDWMNEAADDVDDEHDDEFVNVYDRENPVIEVEKLFPNMDEFRMCFKTYAVRREFQAKTTWTDRKKFYAKCQGFDGGANPCKWYISARRQPDGSTVRVNQMPHEHTCMTSSQNVSRMTSQAWVAEKITPILAKTPNTSTKKLMIDMEKQYPIKLKYTTVWKAKQRAMKELYGDWASTFRLLYSFKAEVEKRSPGSIVEIDTEVGPDGNIMFSKFFMALKPCIDGFKAGCRPYLSVDSSFLTVKWNGQLAACNTLYGHNLMFSVAIGMFQSESTDSWTWFMMQLKRCIGSVTPLAIYSDA